MDCSKKIARRRFVAQSAGALALAGVSLQTRLAWAATLNQAGPLAPKPSHFPPRARQVIFIYLSGGFSHVDTFDPKPKLQTDHGKAMHSMSLRHDESVLPLLASPFEFTRCGKSGLEISELFPCLQNVADDLCVIRSLKTDIVEHFQATLAMHTGSSTIPMPSLGSWLSYGLGTFNANMPSYLVLAEHMPYAGAQVWDNSFLPPVHQGVRIVPGESPIPDLQMTARSVKLHELEQMMLEDMNERHAAEHPQNEDLRARILSYKTAEGMMREAPEVFDLAQESGNTLYSYGIKGADRRSFAWQCLMARRLIERGVRVVELIDTGSNTNWDAHGDIQEHRARAQYVDRPIAALIADLKQRGMLKDTLVVCCTEFGRTPWAGDFKAKGRNHWADAFTCLLAGGGTRGGVAWGKTDEYGAQVVEDPVHVHDYHATILHLLGIDHKKLTYRYAGRDFRLTDVHGKVVNGILA